MSTSTAPRRSDQEQQTRQFAIDAARLAANTRCHHVVVMDVRGISPVTDYMVLATGTSPRQMRTVCEELAEMAEQHGQRPLCGDSLEGNQGGWMLIDFVNVVIHVFSQDARAFYDLDGLWGDAKMVEWNNQPAPSASGT